jgi:uncharacterized protein
MKLAVLDGCFAVCRLPPTAPPPSWVAQSQPFYSITRTADELSIVCREDVVPFPASEHSDADEGTGDHGMQLESGWKTLKVQGPLVFSMTGVLASLASPLAAANVSIFAVSTYDTDYLLVKGAALEQAISALRDSGHEVFIDQPAPSEGNRPRDGPAVSFEPDPLVRRLTSSVGHQPLFSLCLVAFSQTQKAFGSRTRGFVLPSNNAGTILIEQLTGSTLLPSTFIRTSTCT